MVGQAKWWIRYQSVLAVELRDIRNNQIQNPFGSSWKENQLLHTELNQKAINVEAIKITSQQHSDEGPMLETLDHTIRIGSTPTFLYFDLYLYSAYAVHYIYNTPHCRDEDLQ